ncbi:bifunctional glycosyltransferase/CDP-glycerol:glycerophosphate glycerophosphotransferase [Streptomyces nodosus]|uniref:CDP-glycerol:glycerophosphate glycerophosphotransferase n=1 Tax=Streptomyces nodosus TaxID=40318 RepID=A0A0B5DIB8_9ACTN|nr:bifunctional glycosyltransferase family 2 protein/CDP-glycerol:glycerophosphate glycerophosphotransferase [Streptomyces nodosus]AJE40945.1 glycosyl transferase [Streptomyces nodosus]MBB4792042.1 CRISPR system Cascade subunit CasB [Streptomyces nodosus]QEV39494.1 CDP-glycerol:glycerophosphate glycerophosphotransferase [Streptomyces nodosus]
MPRFSVIVPAFKVQAYLQECLTSVLEQSYTDFEVIAVDDCSPDACGAIVDEFAARDPRVHPVHLPQNMGLGRARNAALERASGDYLLFLDGDDTLTPGALRDIADRLKETSDPDVLVFDYARTYWTGQAVRNQLAHLLDEEGPAPFRLDDRPGLLSLLMVVWNKAYRREFVEREGFAFPPGYYEDTPWTFPVLLSADTLATLDRVCVHYRQRRRGSILGSTSRKHFDVLDQYDRVFAHLDAHPGLAHWRPALFHRMVGHLATVYTRRDRLPRDSRAEFLRRARAHYRRHRVPGPPLEPRHLLIRFGAHRTYRLLSAVSRPARGVRRTAARTGRRLTALALRAHYRVQLRLPLRADRAVFTRDGGGVYGCNPGALESAFRQLVPHIRTAWIARPEHQHTVPVATRRLRPGSAAYWTALARSTYLVHNADFDDRMVKRPGQVLIQTRRGTPLARMGLDLLGRPAGPRDTDLARMLRSADTWDYVLSGNRHSTLVWERAYPSGFTALEYGLPRNDVFAHATAADVTRLRQTLGIPEDSVAILYAPTYRDHRREGSPALDPERLLQRLGPRFVLLTRAHPGHGAPPARTSSGRVIDVSGRPSVESLCLASDVLVTDFSSIMFDYANLDRPIVVYADDWETYEATRGTYFDLRGFPPGAIARDEDELIDVFAGGRWCDSRSARLRTSFRERFCPHDDGRAAERIVRRVVLGESAWQPPVVPPADRRPAPAAMACPPAVPPATVPAPARRAVLTERL